MSATVLIVGASVRAAAQSALRAGLRPIGIDLFADRDLAAIAPAHRLDFARYPEGFEALAADLPPVPFFYTGALENHPGLIDRLARTRPILGNTGATLQAVRDPDRWVDVLRRAGVRCPGVQLDPDHLPRDGSWLAKPIDSAGGRAIRPVGLEFEPIRRPCYFQERIRGPSVSAVWMIEDGDARLIGVTRQLLGRPGSPFAYRGSVGPWPIPDSLRARIARVGDVLASAFDLVGPFGVDFVVAGGHPWPVEINPRYTASVEVLELALGQAVLRSFATDSGSDAGQGGSGRASGIVGKVILFADRQCRFPAVPIGRSFDRRAPFAVPPRADVPAPGTRFEAGDPVLTVLARGPDVRRCRRRLDRALGLWRSRLIEDR